MLWLIIIIVIGIVLSNISKRKIKELNDEDLLLFYKYKEMMKGKIIAKLPEGASEWERHIWILASQERDREASKKILNIGLVLFLILVIFLVISSN